MKFILEFFDQQQEVEIDTKEGKNVNIAKELQIQAKKLFPQLENHEIELISDQGFEIVNCNDDINKEFPFESTKVKIQIVDESWIIIKKNSELNLLKDVCESAKNIKIETYNLEQHKQIREDLIVSFQPYYSYFVQKFTEIQEKNVENMNKVFIEVINSIHSKINEINFTGAYIVKLCCDYLTPNFHNTIEQLPSNLLKHKEEFVNFLDENQFEIIASAILKDYNKIEQLVEGHSITLHKVNSADWNNRLNKIMKSSEDNKNIAEDLNIYKKESQEKAPHTDGFYQDFNFEITKVKLQMKCEIYAEAWIQLQILKRVYADQNSEFEQLSSLQDECVKIIKQRRVPIEQLVIKSMDLPLEQLLNDIEKLEMPEKAKSILLMQLYSIRPQSDLKIPEQIREKHRILLTEGEINENIVEKHDKKISCLCLDGGGIRGVIQLILLTELENQTNKKCSELFDLFGGTSIGGIISLALANGHSAQTLLYKFIGSTKNHIFSSRHYVRYLIGVKPDGDDSIYNFALYDKLGIETELYEFFKDLELQQLQANTLITSCEIRDDELTPVVFTKLGDTCGKQNIVGIHPQLEIDTSYSNVKVKDIARASSAAYPFFAATVINGKPFVDGGFLFNNVDILVTTFLLSRGYKRENIKMLSLGNAPKEIASSILVLQNARTAILGLMNCLKGVVNPENYYEQYFAMANLNLDHSLVETKNLLKENYLRLEPDYGGELISLDSVIPDTINKLKTIGVSWITFAIQNNYFDTICKVILNSKVSITPDDVSYQILPRYYSYIDSYTELDNSLKEKNDNWKSILMNFVFKDLSQQIIEPKSLLSQIRYFIPKNCFQDSDLLNRASAIGHIPSIKKVLENKDTQQKKDLILKESTNYWNALHYAAANGEIASFIYLLSVLLDSDIFLPKTDHEIPERMKKCLSNIQWISIRQNIKQFLSDKLSKNLPYSNLYGPLFNYHQVDTIHLAKENQQIAFEKLINLLLSD